MKLLAGGGSTSGSMHRNANLNNQDSFAFRQHPDYVVGVIADGCGSAARSEFGAHLVAYRTVEALDRQLSKAYYAPFIDPTIFDGMVLKATNNALKSLDKALRAHSDDLCKEAQKHFSEALYEYGLCTTLVMIVTKYFFGVWRIGDGGVSILGIDGEFKHHILSPCEGNRPAYLGYRLDPRTIFEQHEMLYPQNVVMMKMYDIPIGVAIMSDGFDLDRSDHQEHIRTILTDSRYTSNPQKTNQFLNKLNAGKQRIIWEERRIERQRSTFEDDATIVFVQFGKDGEP